MLSYYKSSFVFTLLAVVCGYLLGGWPIAYIVLVLGVMETSLSFDNAVVNASVLKNWDSVWRNRFVTWGMPIAVFGMRLIFPLAIVGIIAHINPIAVVSLALEHPDQYAQTLAAAHPQISAFGGTFLMLVFVHFFVEETKDVHWIPLIEPAMVKLSTVTGVRIALVVLTLLLFGFTVPAGHLQAYWIAGVAGIMAFFTVEYLGNLLGGDDDGETATKIIKQGIGGLIYLEVLDASFSFDGVIGSFALSNNIFVIALGLGVGAMFVRSMTLHLVDKGTLNEFKYLEHSAFWAIGVLSMIMLSSAGYTVPEVVTGCVGAIIIGLGVWTSIRANKSAATTA